MKIAYLASTLFFGLFSVALGQNELPQQANNETKGSCSQIIEKNQGSITIKCTGFSEKQNKQILEILHQLSLNQAKDQDALLSKMDEIIATVRATQRQSSPRIISDEMQQRVLRSAWGTCYPGPVQIIAPSGNVESGSLAVQFQNLLSRTPMNPQPIRYANFKRETESVADFKIVTNYANSCGVRFLGVNLSPPFSFIFEQWQDPDKPKDSKETTKREWDPTVPVLIYVYPK